MRSRSEYTTSGKKEVTRLRWQALRIATAVSLLLVVYYAVVQRGSAGEVIFNLGLSLGIAWSVTLLGFELILRLYNRTVDRDERLREKVDELVALQRISREMNATLDLDSILTLMLKEAIATTASTHGYIVLRDMTTANLAAVAMIGYDPSELEGLAAPSAEAGQCIATGVISSGKPAIVSDIQTEKHSPYLRAGTRSVLSVPIFYEGAAAGSINLHSALPKAYNQVHLEFVQALAEQASIAIGNAQRYREQVRLNESLRRRAEQQQGLFEASRSLRMDKPLETILEDIAYAIQESVGFNIVLLSVIEGDPGHLRRVAAAGIPIESFNELKRRTQPLSVVRELFQDRFAISQSYFIPHQEKGIWQQKLDVLTLLPEQEEQEPDRWHAEDILFTPLRNAEGELLGVVSVDDPQDGKIPAQTTIEVLETFAAQAALAIENAQLYNQTQRRISELATLNQIGQALSSTLEADDLLEPIYRHASRIVPVSRFTIALYDEATDEVAFPFIVAGGERSTAQALPEEAELIWRLIRAREPLMLPVVNGKATEPARLESATEAAPEAQGMWLGVPMMAVNKVVGAIAVQSLEVSRAENEEDLSLLLTIATQAAAALQNAHLYQQIRRFNTELERRVQQRTEELAEANRQLTLEKERAQALYRITRELGASLDLDRVLNRALDLVSQAIGASHGAILMLDTPSNKMAYRLLLGQGRPLTPEERAIPISQDVGLVGWVMQNRKPLILADAPQDRSWVVAPLVALGEVRSVIAAPLMLGDEVLGILALSDAQANLFNAEHARLVSAAASQVAQAISNAELYRLIREQAERLGNALRAQQTEASEKASILEGITDGVVVVNPRGQVILVNRAAEDILNASANRLMGRSVHELGISSSQPRDRAILGLSWIKEWISQPWEQLEGQTLEERYEADGRVINVRLSLVQMSGEILGAVAVFRDITKEVQADRAKTEFISTVSHELRTPMTSIKGYTDLLLMGAVGELNEAQNRFLSIIRSNVDRLGSLVGDLLDLSRIESGRMRLEIEPVEIDQVLNQVVSSMRGQFATQRILLTAQIPPALPRINGDKKRIIQVLSNLLDNACRYTLPGGKANVSAHVEQDEVQIDIADTGIGISEEEQKHIFERFFRGDHPLVQEKQGTGLGLAIVKSIVEMHGGRVWMQSRLGEGSTFSLALPIAKESTPFLASVGKDLLLEGGDETGELRPNE